MKKQARKISVQEKVCARTESQSPAAPDEADNLEKLARSGKLEEFVRKNNGEWDHQLWLDLCREISADGYEPIDLDKVGLLLEQNKAVYLSNLKSE